VLKIYLFHFTSWFLTNYKTEYHFKKVLNTIFPIATYAMLRGEFCMWEFDNGIEL